MKYEHIEKGTILDSPSVIVGESWVPVNDPKGEIENLSFQQLQSTVLDQQAKIDELETIIEKLKRTPEVELSEPKEVEEETEPEEQEVDLQQLTNKELEDLAKEQGIELTAEDKRNKDTRIAAIVKALG